MSFDMNAFNERYAKECDIGTPRYALEYTGHGYSSHRELVQAEDGDWVRAEAYADLRAKLELFRGHVCSGCGCATGISWNRHCYDCHLGQHGKWAPEWSEPSDAYVGAYISACISIGMRALCGRRIFDE